VAGEWSRDKMDKRKVGSENGYSAYSTPIQTKIQRPSLTSSPLRTASSTVIGHATSPRLRATANGTAAVAVPNLADIINTPQELEKIFSNYGELIKQRKSEVSELKKVNNSRQYDDTEGDETAEVQAKSSLLALLISLRMSMSSG
jgi:hypothetical protein